MGAGRHTQTFLTPANAGPSGGGGLGPPPHRNLGRTELGGVIFGCTHVTMSECLSQNLFGLPQHHIKYVQHIHPGMCLFLFNFSGRMLHGIYEAVGDGSLNIEPSAWTDGKNKTQYPAQVKFRIRQSCSPLPEATFKEAICDNYFAEGKFTFELTFAQKDHLVSLFTKNMQITTKSIPINPVPQPVKSGGPVKSVWKKSGDVDNVWAMPTNSVNVTLGNAWQKSGPPDSGKGTFANDVKSYSFHHSHSQEEEASDSKNEQIYKYDKLRSDAAGPITSKNTSEDTNSSSDPEMGRQEPSIAKYGEAGSGYPSDGAVQKEQDKAARQRDVLEKLQRLDPSRADTQQQQSVVLERFQALDVSGADPHQTQQSDLLKGGVQYGSPAGPETSTGMIVAVTPTKAADWERLAKDQAAKEQAHLREERERLWVTASAVDMNAATAFKRCLEISAATIAQMRQESIEINRVMTEVRTRTDQQLEQQKTLEKLLTSNLLLEQSRMSMAAELAELKVEMGELKSHINTLDSQGQDHNSELLLLSTSGVYQSGVSVLSTQRVRQPQCELYILGGLANKWLDTVVVYSPVSNQYRTAPPLLAPRSYAASSTLDNYIYIYGGGDGLSWSDSVERYSHTSNKWEACPPMGIKRGSLGGATVRDKIFAVGGGYGATSFDDTECYDPNIGTWIPSTKMLERRFCVAAADVNGAIYALGGFDGMKYLMSMERFDPREAHWTPAAPMISRRGSLSAAVINEKLYALGGFDGRDFLKTVEVYDPRANAWMPGPSMISERAYGASAILDGALYMMGGMEMMNQSFETSTMKMERYTEATGWQDVAMNSMINRNFVAAAVL